MKKHSHFSRAGFLKLFYTFLFLLLTLLILTHSSESLYYALNGLNLWFTKMIPALLPFMILSGIMVRLQLTESFSSLLYPLLHPLFRIRRNVCYAIIMGFLCGFPMGARVTSDLYERDMITHREACFLLAFCNNIGPVYFCSFVLPLLHRELIFPYVFGMYGIPLGYGLLLRYTCFRHLEDSTCKTPFMSTRSRFRKFTHPELHICGSQEASSLKLLEQIDDSIMSAIQSILMLGGYMVLFNLLNLVPGTLLGFWGLSGQKLALFLAPVLEITGGLGMLGDSHPLAVLLFLPFGGLSCIAQTYSMIKDTGLSILPYCFHKLVLCLLTGLYYLGWFCLFPSSFLR